MRKLKKGLFILAAILFSIYSQLSTASDTKMKVHFIDVGQGSATLIEFECGAILVDTGAERNAMYDGGEDLLDYLDEFFRIRPDLNRTFDLLVITHPHIDHTANIRGIFRNYNLLNVITNGQQTGSGKRQQKKLKTYSKTRQLNYLEISVDDIPQGLGLSNNVIDPIKCNTIDPKITALWGRVDKDHNYYQEDKMLRKKTFDDNENNHSISLRIDFGKSSMLLSGDLEKDAIPYFLKHNEGSGLLNVDLISVNHHGSENGVNKEYLDATTPDYAVISMGPSYRDDHNVNIDSFTAHEHGHPRAKVVKLLEDKINNSRDKPKLVEVSSKPGKFEKIEMDKAVYATGWDGNIVLEADSNGNWEVSFDEN